jgi:pimeloyl-ACP methyl ester carboxylesterase
MRWSLRAAALAFALLAVPACLAGAWLLYAGLRLTFTETLTRQQAAPAGGRWLRAYDTQVHVMDWGPAGAPTLLLVHGTGAWAGTWVSNIAAMQAAGFRVVAMDLPPFGFSEPPAGRDYSRGAQARRILAVAAQLDPQPVTLLAHSFGGGPAAEAAMLEPGCFAHLVLVDAALALGQDAPRPCAEPGIAANVLGWRGLRTLLAGAIATEPALSSHWLAQFVARKEVVTAERTAIYQKPFVVRGFTEGLGDWAYQFASSCEQPASTRPASYRQLQLPVSLIWGELDTITPPEQARRVRSLLPRVRLVMLKGVGHIPQIEDVPGFNAAVAQVLRQPPAGR